MSATRALATTAVALIGLLADPGPTQAAAPDIAELAAWLDADATAVLKLEPAQLERAAVIARAAGGNLASGANVLATVSRGVLGFDVTDAGAWTDAGLGSPILFQVSAIDGAAATRIHDALAVAARWDARTYRSLTKTYFRSRLVIPTSDVSRAQQTLSKIRALPQLYPVESEHAADIALLLGASARTEAKLLAWLRARDVFLVGWIDGADALVLARAAGKDLVVIDVLASFAGLPVVWDRERKQLGALIARGGRGGLSKRLATGAAQQLAGEGLALWLSPEGMWETGRAMSQLEHLRAVSAALSAGESVPKPTEPPTVCKSFREVAQRGAFEDMAVRVSFADKQLELSAAWGLRKSYGLAAALSTVDHRLPTPSSIADVSVAATMYLAGTTSLRGLARPDAMSGSWEKLWASVERCRAGSATIVALFGWPQIAGLYLDELAALDPTAQDTIAGAGNLSIAITRLAWTLPQFAGAGEIAFDDAGARAVKGYSDALFGARNRHQRPIEHTTWGRGAIRPYAYPLATRQVVGSTFGGAKVAWRLAHKAGKPLKRPPVLRVAGRLDRLFEDLGAPDVGSALAQFYGKSLRAVGEHTGGVFAITARARKR